MQSIWDWRHLEVCSLLGFLFICIPSGFRRTIGSTASTSNWAWSASDDSWEGWETGPAFSDSTAPVDYKVSNKYT